MKDRRKPWQKKLTTFRIAKCGTQLAENARKFYRYSNSACGTTSRDYECTLRAYADALGVSVDVARKKVDAQYHIQRYGRPA